MDESGLIEFGKDEEIELSDDDSKYEENQTERANIAFGEYCESGAPRALVAFLNCLEKGDVTAIKYNDTVRDDIFFEMVGNKTVLQYLIENNVTLSFSIKSAIQKNVELLKVYFSYGKYDILSFASNDVMLQEIDGISLIEYLFKNNLINKVDVEHIVPNFRSREIIVLCIKYNKLDLLKYVSEVLLFEKLDDNRRIIDYIYENGFLDESVISRVYINEQIIQYCIDHNKESLLAHLNETILKRYYDKENKITYLEYLLDRGVIFKTFLMDVNLIKIIISKGKFECLEGLSTSSILDEVEPGKTVFEAALDNGFVLKKAISSLDWGKSNNSEQIINILVNHNRFDLLTKMSDDCYLYKIGDKTVFEIMADNNVFPNKLRYSNLELAKLFAKYGKYDELGKVDDDILVQKYDDDNLLVDELLSHNGTIVNKCDNKAVLKSIIKYKRYELLARIRFKTLLLKANLNETYLDIMLNKFNEGLDIDVTPIWISGTITQKAKTYLIYAKHDMVEYLPRLEKKDLLEQENGKRLIDELIRIDKQLTVDKVISRKVKEEFEIAMILRLGGAEQKEIKLDSITRDLQREYIDDFYREYDEYKLDPESESLLREFEILMSDGKSDMDYVQAMIRSYRHIIYINSIHKAELIHLIEIKKRDPNFSLKKVEAGAYYNSTSNTINLDDANIETLNHETGHALFHNMTDGHLPLDNITQIFDILEKSPKFLEKVKEYSDKFNKIVEEVEHYVDETFMKAYDESITDEKRKEIEEFVSKSKEEKKQIYLEKKYDEGLLDTILDRTYSVDEYLEQDRRVKRNEMIELVLRMQYSELVAIGDYFDGIYKGKFRSGKLVDKDGKKIDPAFGHGINYYARGPSWVVDEMLANYSEIMKSKNPEEGIKLLRYFIGDEVVNYISEYYNNEIIRSTHYHIEGRSI